MNVMIIATKGCSHCSNFSKELSDLEINHCIVFAEDEPELCQKHHIRHSPNLVVDDVMVFRHQPSESELKEYFSSIKIV